jgi:type IV secretory pathway TrbL component
MLKLLIGNPYVLIGIAAAFALSIGAAIWFHHDAVTAEKSEKAALAQLASAVERANANHDAAESQRLQVEADKRTIAMQGVEIERWRADSLAMKQTNDALVRAGRQDAERRLAEINAQEEDARAHPEDIHRLSPRVHAVADSLSSE